MLRTLALLSFALPWVPHSSPFVLHGCSRPALVSLKSEVVADDTLFARIGGEAALTAAVEEFYHRLTLEESLQKYFKGVDLETLKQHQYNFMRLAFTDIPKDLDIRTYLIEHHSRLFKMGMGGDTFDVVAGHFVGTLQDLSVPENMIDEAVGIVGPLRPFFVEGHDLFAGEPE